MKPQALASQLAAELASAGAYQSLSRYGRLEELLHNTFPRFSFAQELLPIAARLIFTFVRYLIVIGYYHAL